MEDTKELLNRTAGEETAPQPVLVYGPRKAGTTLLQSLLDGSPALLMIPGELKLKVFVRRKGRSKEDPMGLFVERGRSIFAALFERKPGGQGIQAKDGPEFSGLSRARLSALFDAGEYVARLSELLARKPTNLGGILTGDASAFAASLRGGHGDTTRWASKEVGGDPGEVLDLFLQHFPRGRIVFAVRQPEFVVRSILLKRRRKGGRMSIRRIFHECRDAQNIVSYCHNHALGRDVVVAYERLTADTAREIARICQELKIPFDEIMTVPTTLGEPVVVHTSSRQTTKVFHWEGNWWDDLTWREVLVIRLFNAWSRFVCHKDVPYERLMVALDAQRKGD